MADSKKPLLTQSMKMHLNGGSKFSELHYDIQADGKPTGITRHKRTNGSPNYLIVHDYLQCGDDTFDVMETRGVGMEDWLFSRVMPDEPEESTDSREDSGNE